MKSRFHVFAIAVIALLLTTVHSGEAQVKRKMTQSEILAALKPGQWVQLEGIVRKDFSVVCMEVQILTGDFLDDDWALSGIIRKIDQQKQEMQILLLPIKCQKDAEFQSDAGTFKSFADLKVGMLVELEGTYLKDGTFLAKEIENESAKLTKEPGLKDEIQGIGKVEKVDVAKRTIRLMGITFQLTDKTKGKSALK
jgi:hypothetical protein